MKDTPPILAVSNLCVDARTPTGLKPVLQQVGFSVAAGETLCLAGESGSGKSVTSLAIMGLLPKASLRVSQGSIRLSGRELVGLPNSEMRKIRGGEIAMIFQEPMTSLNPVMTVGAQLTEAIREHGGGEGGSADAVALRMLDAVHMTEPARRLTQYPHELSGGMRQRVMIAMALSCRPKVMIADEPTTALDVTVQAQILKLMKELKQEFGTSIILITHDMGVVAEMADRVLIMQQGRCVEEDRVARIFNAPKEAYTKSLLASVLALGSRSGTDGPPKVSSASSPVAASAALVLEVKDLSVTYGASQSWFRRREVAATVQGVSFSIRPGETLGLVGESGSGKSTTGKAVLGLVPFSGSVKIGGQEIAGLSATEMRPVRRSAQMIFQDPYASLDPRMAVGEAIAEPLLIHGLGTEGERTSRVADLLQRVGLPADAAARYPHEFSGGQRQRICIARALALNPKLIVADESVAALDVSVRARVLDLLLELQEQLGLSYLFISHDMAVVEYMSHHVAVMKAGRIVEMGSRRKLFENPSNDYTRALMDAVPVPAVAG
ncbi:ABC transporter ATP-binding protein [Aestuariivirga sp.]|uniref:ABC transporter ATP-binding protein n=1 Tax=Aestuariivirga sp. TaxID=2650926 RepID=UPI0039E61A5A